MNNGQPIMDGTTLAEQKGVRDPYIVRGPDIAFYLAMTDLHIFLFVNFKRRYMIIVILGWPSG